jgi:hypothetical protein
VKPSTKSNEPIINLDFLAEPSATPEMYPRYPGTSGNTHGETNEIRPASNARGMAARSEPFRTISAGFNFSP